MSKRLLTPTQEDQLISMRLEGATHRELGKHFGIPLNTAGEYCRRAIGAQSNSDAISDEKVEEMLKEWRGNEQV